MAYRELVETRSMNQVLGITVKPARARLDYWDGGALGRSGWGVSLSALFALIVALIIVTLFWLAAYPPLTVIFSPTTPWTFEVFLEAYLSIWESPFMQSARLVDSIFIFGSVALWLTCIWVVAKIFQSWRWGAIISLAGKVRWRLGLMALCVGVAVWLLTGVLDLSIGYIVERSLPTFNGFSTNWLWAILLLVPFVFLQSSAEEVLFRGYLPQILRHILPKPPRHRLLVALILAGIGMAIVSIVFFSLQAYRNDVDLGRFFAVFFCATLGVGIIAWIFLRVYQWLPNLAITVLCSAGFASIHLGNSDVSLFPWIAMAEFFVLSCALSWLTLRLGGVEVACVLHAIHNIFLVMFVSIESFEMYEHVMFSVKIDEEFGTHWMDWIVFVFHIATTITVFWAVGMWRLSPLSLVRAAERYGPLTQRPFLGPLRPLHPKT